MQKRVFESTYKQVFFYNYHFNIDVKLHNWLSGDYEDFLKMLNK